MAATRKAVSPAKTKAAKPESAAAPELPSFGDIGKLIENFKLPGVNMDAIVESQRKDLEALVEANRQAYAGIKALIERRNEIMRESLTQWQDALKGATGEDALKKGAEAARLGVKQAVENFRELYEMEAQARSNAWKVVQDRMQENLANLQKLVQPK